MSATDTYSCPVDDCDYEIFAVGLQDPDEPDYFTEDIEQHKRGHVVESQHIDSATHASSSQAGLASLIPSTGAVTAPTPAPVDAATPDWDAMADAYGPECAACEGDDDASHVVGCLWIAKRREAVPSLVELDRRDVTDRVLGAALEWEYAISAVAPPPVAMRPAVAAQALLAAVRDYRAVIGR